MIFSTTTKYSVGSEQSSGYKCQLNWSFCRFCMTVYVVAVIDGVIPGDTSSCVPDMKAFFVGVPWKDPNNNCHSRSKPVGLHLVTY